VPLRALHCVPEHRASNVVDPMKLMLLVMVLFCAAREMSALPPKVAIALAGVDAMYFLPSALNVNVKKFKQARVIDVSRNDSLKKRASVNGTFNFISFGES